MKLVTRSTKAGRPIRPWMITIRQENPNLSMTGWKLHWVYRDHYCSIDKESGIALGETLPAWIIVA